MKRKITTAFFMLMGVTAIAQTPPQGNPPANNVNAQARAAWYRGGNTPSGTNPTTANIFGTMWNSPIYTYTAGTNRSRLNGTLTAPINGVNQNVSGFMGLAPNGYLKNNFVRRCF